MAATSLADTSFGFVAVVFVLLLQCHTPSAEETLSALDLYCNAQEFTTLLGDGTQTCPGNPDLDFAPCSGSNDDPNKGMTELCVPVDTDISASIFLIDPDAAEQQRCRVFDPSQCLEMDEPACMETENDKKNPTACKRKRGIHRRLRCDLSEWCERYSNYRVEYHITKTDKTICKKSVNLDLCGDSCNAGAYGNKGCEDSYSISKLGLGLIGFICCKAICCCISFACVQCQKTDKDARSAEDPHLRQSVRADLARASRGLPASDRAVSQHGNVSMNDLISGRIDPHEDGLRASSGGQPPQMQGGTQFNFKKFRETTGPQNTGVEEPRANPHRKNQSTRKSGYAGPQQEAQQRQPPRLQSQRQIQTTPLRGRSADTE